METEHFGNAETANNEGQGDLTDNAQSQVGENGAQTQNAENEEQTQPGAAAVELKHTKKCALNDGADCNCGAAEKAAKAAEKAAAKAAAEKSASQPAQPAKRRTVVVDEPVEKWIQVVHSTVVFRPGEVLNDPHKIRLAEEHGILTRER